MMSEYATIEEAIIELQQGRMLVLEDDPERENEGDLIIAAEKVTPEAINFMSKHGRGLICLPLALEYIKHFNLPMMTTSNRSKFKTGFTVSIGAAKGITSGISAADRARTVQAVVADGATAEDIVTPGHIFPLRAEEDGVLARQGHTEGSVDLMKLAGLKPAAVLCEIMNETGEMARGKELVDFAKKFGLKRISVAAIRAHRLAQGETQAQSMNSKTPAEVQEVARAVLPLQTFGKFEAIVFRDSQTELEHVALVNLPNGPENTQHSPTLVRFHSECLTGETFGSTRCDCGWQLTTALQKISEEGGVLIYARQEGRGIGLANKIRAYALQEKGLDTVEANHKLGFLADQRDYKVGAEILKALHMTQIRLMTNNPQKLEGLQCHGINVVARESIEMPPHSNNLAYLKTKRDKLAHILNFEES